MLFDRVFGQPSARVVALARVGLATVFFIATLNDPKVGQSDAVIPILASFFCFSGIVAVITWRDWWIDARIAVAAHAIDIAFFTAMVALPDGYSSPYFLFFAFLLLSSAIRWEWKETTITALLVIALYVVAGLAFAHTAHSEFESRRFVIRSGYLVVLSAVLVWFGVRRRFSAGRSLLDPASAETTPGESQLANAMRQIMYATKAGRAVAVWKSLDGRIEAESASGHHFEPLTAAPEMLARLPDQAMLFDTRKNRALVASPLGKRQFTTPDTLVDRALLEQLPATQGMCIPVRSTLGEGLFLLWCIEDLHSDHLPVGERMQSEIAYALDHFTVVSALRESAIARERLSLARDLHDGIVQFLAGSAYKIETMSQSSTKGSDVSADLQELKQLMLLEHEDLRASIGALRTDKVTLEHTTSEAHALCERLSRQWHVTCAFSSEVVDARIPTRLHADVMHMIKEGVANAARHASAQKVEIGMRGNARSLDLTIRNDGRPKKPRPPAVPWSIQERIAEIGGSASIRSDERFTTVSVFVPIADDGR